MIPFRLSFEPGLSLYEQVVYAAKKAVISGQMRPGDPFPSVRALSKALKINPNTAHKVVTQLVAEGLLEVHSGIGTVVAKCSPSTAADRGNLLNKELEQLVVEAMKLGLSLEDVQAAVVRHWKRLRREERMSDIVRAMDLGKRYGRTGVLNHLNLAVPEGSVYGLVGQNGAGKTTLIKILMNIQQAASGAAEVFGRDTRRLSPADFTQIGYVSENQELPDWMTVGYHMSYLAPFYPNWDHKRAAELLTQFQLPLDRTLRRLSHGMR